MPAFVEFDCFLIDLGKKVHHLDTDALKVCLTNTAPDVVADAVYADIVDLATAGGYIAGGLSLGSNAWSQVGGVATLVAGGSPVFTATTGFGPFRYAVLYNFTAAAKNLIGYWDNGTSVSIAAAGNFDFNIGSPALRFHF